MRTTDTHDIESIDREDINQTERDSQELVETIEAVDEELRGGDDE